MATLKNMKFSPNVIIKTIIDRLIGCLDIGRQSNGHHGLHLGGGQSSGPRP